MVPDAAALVARHSVDLAVAHVVVHVCEGLLVALLHIPPSRLCIVLDAVQTDGVGQEDVEGLAALDGEQLGVDVEDEVDRVVLGDALEARNAVVLVRVDVVDGEGIFEDLCVGHGERKVAVGGDGGGGLSGASRKWRMRERR